MCHYWIVTFLPEAEPPCAELLPDAAPGAAGDCPPAFDGLPQELASTRTIMDTSVVSRKPFLPPRNDLLNMGDSSVSLKMRQIDGAVTLPESLRVA